MRDVIVTCDAPGCERRQISTDQNVNPRRWLCAAITVSTPVPHEPECEHDAGWHFDDVYESLDACCVEHLRSAMAAAIANMTDEQVSP